MLRSLLSKALILLIISTSLVTHAEDIVKEFEISNVLITFYWFDTEKEMQQAYIRIFGPEDADVEVVDGLLRGFSGTWAVPEKNICVLDLYAVRPQEVDDDATLTIGHEVLHCVYGTKYHRIW